MFFVLRFTFNKKRDRYARGGFSDNSARSYGKECRRVGNHREQETPKKHHP